MINLINNISSIFLWHGSLDNSSSAKVSWNSHCFPKEEGGLEIRSLSSWNETCGLKLIWMLLFRGGSIWVAWMRHRYFNRQSFWALNETNFSFSWTFRKILKLRTRAMSFFSVHIGNGEDSYFWWDPWTPYGPLIHHLGPSGPSSLGIPQSTLVCEKFNSSGWDLPPARSELHVGLLAYISSIQYSNASDSPLWLIGDKQSSSFCSRAVWNAIRPTQPSVLWAPLIWHNGHIAKHATTA